jgi:hypothetical protein
MDDDVVGPTRSALQKGLADGARARHVSDRQMLLVLATSAS